jgi:hypothetical protein
MRIPTAFAAAAVTAVACAALPAAANAGTTGTGFDTKLAVYEATLSGSQVTTWHYEHNPSENEPCVAPQVGDGDQTIRFKVPGKLKLSFIQPNKKAPDLLGTDGRLAVSARKTIAADITAERNGDFKAGQPSAACEGPNGGGVIPDEQRPKDCGTRTGKTSLKLFFNLGGLDDDLYVPLPGDKKDLDKDRLKLDAFGESYTGPNGRSGSLDGTFENCPFLLEPGFAENQGLLYTSAAKVSENKIIKTKKGKSIVISGSTIANVGEGDYSGKTIIAWNLRMKRVK